jgi:hypothetical protein
MSADHHWGPRAMLFLAPSDLARYGEAIRATMAEKLPRRFLGYSTHFSPPDPNDGGVQLMADSEAGPINHRVELFDIASYLRHYLGYDMEDQLRAADWLTFPAQKLRTLANGAVYHNGNGLQTLLDRFAYYPKDVWLYLLAAGWVRIGQEEHLMGRAGYVGDDAGSALIGGRLVRDVMQLSFLMERQYAPYAKWFGTAFGQLACAPRLMPLLHSALRAETWQARQVPLADAYGILGEMHNTLGLTDYVDPTPRPFFGRPFTVIFGERFAVALKAVIMDPEVQRIAARPLIGGIDQFSDSTDFREAVELRAAVKRLYE